VTDANVLSNKGSESGDPSSSLLVRVRSKDQAAWERLVRLYTPLVYRWCRQNGLQAADAADVGQEVFQAVARKIGDFRRDSPRDSFRGWLRVITRNKLTDYRRSLHARAVAAGGTEAEALLRQTAEDLPPPDPDSDAEELDLLVRKTVELIRGEFEDRTWRAFWGMAIDGRPAADVASELGISANAVYLAKGRVLRRLREELAGLEEL
jgi:RNA polymerase sigma-70 factor (ECF subfamily)